jgi:hypothetical protein
LIDLPSVSAGHVHEPIQGSARLIVPSGFARALVERGDELDRRLEQVHVQSQLMGVEVIESQNGRRCLVAVPADELADMRPVFYSM